MGLGQELAALGGEHTVDVMARARRVGEGAQQVEERAEADLAPRPDGVLGGGVIAGREQKAEIALDVMRRSGFRVA